VFKVGVGDFVMKPLDFVTSSVEPFLQQDVAEWWPHHIDQSAWLEHTPLAAWLVPMLKPRVLVELGTHRAVSYLAFCQASAKLDVPAKCYAVDTWEGDEHAGIYTEDIFKVVEKLNAQYGEFSTLMRCRFTEALPHFQDASIDLLHIDGLHTYEAVSEDFHNWLPKMSDRGIILFHDTEVKERNFGVWKLWEEAQQKFPHFEFLHGHGLGILAVGKLIPGEMQFLFDAESKRQYTEKVHEFFKTTGTSVSRHYGARMRAGGRRVISDTTLDVALDPKRPRKDLLLAGARKDWLILEIGPSHAPIADKKSGWNTSIIDHASREELIEKYKDDKTVDTRFIEEVDFVWRGEKLDELIPREKHGRFDVIIASHVIEHFPDPVGVLKSAEKLLRPDTGLISLAVPDKRLCFDFFRPLSTTGKFLAAYREGRVRHSAADLFDSIAYLAALKGDTSWGWCKTEAVNPRYRLDFAYPHFLKAYDASNQDYQDCHGWMFTPASFELVMLELSALGVLDWHIQSILPQAGVEFIVHLARGKPVFASDDEFEKRRAALLKEIQKDLHQQTSYYFGCISGLSQPTRLSLAKSIWRKAAPLSVRQRLAKLRGKI
jgi:SAM-dependent methyltransferase